MRTIPAATANPRDFYDKMLKPAYNAWLEEPYQEWRAKAAVAFANDFVERMAFYLNYSGGPRKYREYIKESVCSEFGWVWDVADGTKHFSLTRGARRVSSANQTSFRFLNIDDWTDIDSIHDFDNHGAIIVTSDDGVERDLADLMAKVMAMCEGLLKKHGL